MKPRILIFDDNDILRFAFKDFLDERGYEVFAFHDPAVCPLHSGSNCDCPLDNACADIIISDVNMPTMTGLEFIESRIQNGCKVKYRALMSGDWTNTDLQRAQKLGCRIFHKPFSLREIIRWLDDCSERIDSDRKLTDWFTNKDLMSKRK